MWPLIIMLNSVYTYDNYFIFATKHDLYMEVTKLWINDCQIDEHRISN